MGWLVMSRWNMGGFNTPKTYLDNNLNYPPDPKLEGSKGLRLLKSVWSGKLYHAAVQSYDTSGTAGDVFAIVCLVRWSPHAKNGDHFGYKDMDETMGPGEAKCPTSILKLLGPPRNQYAADWRRRCHEWNALVNRRKPRPGDTIILPEPIAFTDGYKGMHFTIIAYGKGIAMRGLNGRNYRITRLMERAWTCFPAMDSLAKAS